MKTTEGDVIERVAGSEWWVVGPATYLPQVGSRIVCRTKPIVLHSGRAVRLRARKNLIDANGTKRATGEEWLHSNPGPYLPGIDEVIVTESVSPIILTDKDGLHLTATKEFTDRSGHLRKAGDKWLVTSKESESYLLNVEETLLAKTEIVSLTKREYVRIQNPVGSDGVPKFGHQEIRKGECTFFLKPGETIVEKKEVEVLTATEALEVQSLEDHTKPERHQAGERWLIIGPKEYWPELNIQILGRRTPPLQIGNYCIWSKQVIPGMKLAFLFFILMCIYFFFKTIVSFFSSSPDDVVPLTE